MSATELELLARAHALNRALSHAPVLVPHPPILVPLPLIITTFVK